MNCNDCLFCSNSEFSSHKRCNILRGSSDQNLGELLLANGSAMINVDVEGKNVPAVEINPHGKENGWATWPIDFDPIWIDNCYLFSENTEEKRKLWEELVNQHKNGNR